MMSRPSFFLLFLVALLVTLLGGCEQKTEKERRGAKVELIIEIVLGRCCAHALEDPVNGHLVTCRVVKEHDETGHEAHNDQRDSHCDRPAAADEHQDQDRAQDVVLDEQLE